MPEEWTAKKTMTMNWDGLRDDDDEFFEPRTTNAPRDLASDNSDDDNDDFDDCDASFPSTAPPAATKVPTAAPTPKPAAAPDYNMWMSSPGSIKARRQKLFQGMGLNSSKQLLTFKRIISSKPSPQSVPVPAPVPAPAPAPAPAPVPAPATVKNTAQAPAKSGAPANVKTTAPTPAKSVAPAAATVETTAARSAPTTEPKKPTNEDSKKQTTEDSSKPELPHSPVSFVLVRSRSEGEIESRSVEKQRKTEMLGIVSKQRLTRTYSLISTPSAKSYVLGKLKASSPRKSDGNRRNRQSGPLTSMVSKRGFEGFLVIKNLDTGKEFIVNESDRDGKWNKLSDLQTGKKLTMEEFDKSVGYSPMVKELMRRANDTKPNWYNSSKSLKMSMSKGAAMLKSITNSMALRGDKEREVVLALEQNQKLNHAMGGTGNNQWVKVRPTGKSYKELSALHLCQEIQAHEGSIWAIKFNTDARYLASAGEDTVIHVWEVQECEVMTNNEGGLTPGSSPVHPSLAKPGPNKNSQIPDYVHKPEVVFSLSDKPICSFKGHNEDVLDLSWSKSKLLSSSMDKTVRLWDLETKSCLKVFAHSDYVTCIHFNPVDDDHFISGSLDEKVRIWNISQRRVVDWTDICEMVTAACYSPDGQGALIGSHKGNCRLYSTEECKLNQKEQLNLQIKKANAKKITGFQYCPTNPSQLLVTSADSRIRIMEGSEMIYRFTGFRNSSSQIPASFTPNGKYVLTASEDSQVFVWRFDEPKHVGGAKRTAVTARGYEQFPCKAVSIAIPWPGTIKGEPPTMGGTQSKRNSRRTQSCDIPQINEDIVQPNKKGLPPLPNKKNSEEKATSPSEEEPAQTCPVDPGISEESSSSSTSKGDSPSLSSSSMRAAGDHSPSNATKLEESGSVSSSAAPSIWSWFDVVGGGAGSNPTEATAWGLVIVTASHDGEIKIYQNFGLPRKIALI